MTKERYRGPRAFACSTRGPPHGVLAPIMEPLKLSTATVLVVGLTSGNKSLMDLRTAADWTLRPRLLAVPGVASVSVFGGKVKQLQIQPLPDKLVQYNLALSDVVAAAQKATGVLGAGFIENSNQRLVVQTEGQSISPAQIAATVLVRQNGANATLGQVANVIAGPAPPFGAASVEGQTGVILTISGQYGSNTADVTTGVEKALAELNPALHQQGILMRSDLFKPAKFIDIAVHNVRDSLLLGAALVIVVLFLFLFDLRVAAISCSAIPLSLLIAVTIMDRMGFTLNTLTLGGLAIAIGEVVDDAVIDVENILRRLRENAALGHPRSAFSVVLDASIEVRSAVVYATFAVILVFLPILTLSGVAGRLFAPLGIAYILSVLASLVVALTVTPALSLLLLGHRKIRPTEPPVVLWLQKRYRALLERIERAPRLVIGFVAVLTILGAAALPFFAPSFLPELREGHYIVHMTSVRGSSLEDSLRVGREVTTALQKLPFVRSVGQRVGRAELSEDTTGPNYSELEVDLKPLSGEDEEASVGTMRNTLSQFSGVSFSILTFLTERIEETISGYTALLSSTSMGTISISSTGNHSRLRAFSMEYRERRTCKCSRLQEHRKCPSRCALPSCCTGASTR